LLLLIQNGNKARPCTQVSHYRHSTVGPFWTIPRPDPRLQKLVSNYQFFQQLLRAEDCRGCPQGLTFMKNSQHMVAKFVQLVKFSTFTPGLSLTDTKFAYSWRHEVISLIIPCSTGTKITGLDQVNSLKRSLFDAYSEIAALQRQCESLNKVVEVKAERTREAPVSPVQGWRADFCRAQS
jgi:hypothetical protein